jgi:hypothetical protein
VICDVGRPQSAWSVMTPALEEAVTATCVLFGMHRNQGVNGFQWVGYKFRLIDAEGKPINLRDKTELRSVYLEWWRVKDDDQLTSDYLDYMENRVPLTVRRSIWAMLRAGNRLLPCDE